MRAQKQMGTSMTLKEMTARQVQAITAPGLHRVAPQLYLSIKPTANATRSWVLRLTVNGRATWRGLGSCRHLSLADAKAKAMRMRADIHTGDFDSSPRKRAKPVPTFGEIAEQYISDNESGWRYSRAGLAWRSSLSMHVSALMKMPVNAITPVDVKNAIHKVWIERPQTAKKLRGRIERILESARVHGHRTGSNPATWGGQLSHMLPKLSTEGTKHYRAVPLVEIPELAVGLVALGSISAKALLFTILCPVRTGDTRKAVWSEFDLPGRAWNMPAGRTKSKRPFRIPLADAAIALLTELPRDSEYVFPGKDGKPLSNMAMLQCLRGIKGMGLTVHGMRSSFKDWSLENEFHEELSEVALDHRVGDKTRNAYARTDLWVARQKLMAAWSAFVMQNVGSKGRLRPVAFHNIAQKLLDLAPLNRCRGEAT